ncbi:hypothetical protein ADL02_31060 [Streptomyces sp. NRRL WC-3723]|nr:hypothetical protein ADL02_31060 [Streptomyces sp. NRRL WC-3723]
MRGEQLSEKSPTCGPRPVTRRAGTASADSAGTGCRRGGDDQRAGGTALAQTSATVSARRITSDRAAQA